MQASDRNGAETAATHISHAGSRMLFRHWEALRAERPCPTRAEFDLSGIAKILPNVAIIEERPHGSWRYRLAGSAVCTLLGHNATGKGVLDGFEDFERGIVSRVLDIAQSRLQPGLVRMRLFHSRSDYAAIEMLILPVINQATGSTQLMASLFSFQPSAEAESRNVVKRELVSARLIWTEHEINNDSSAIFAAAVRKPLRLRVIDGGLASQRN